MRAIVRRVRSLRIPLLALAAGAGLYLAPPRLDGLQAQEGSTCNVDCGNGKTCSASGPNCSCTCSLFLNIPQCRCTTDVVDPAGGG